VAAVPVAHAGKAPGPLIAHVSRRHDRAHPAVALPGSGGDLLQGTPGAVTGTLDSLPGYLCDTAYEHDPWAYAEIACYARVFVDMRGVRAEHARLVRIALPDTGWPGQAAPDEASRMLHDRYGVPAGGMDCAPGSLTANVRPGGPPPDSEEPQPRSRAPGPVMSRGPKLNHLIVRHQPRPGCPAQISPDALTSEAAAV
jgi:hypothetical protein